MSYQTGYEPIAEPEVRIPWYRQMLIPAVLALTMTSLIFINLHAIAILNDECKTSTIEISCQCFNTTGWVLVNDTTCCSSSVPNICQNTTTINAVDYNGKCIEFYPYLCLAVILFSCVSIVISFNHNSTWVRIHFVAIFFLILTINIFNFVINQYYASFKQC